MEKHKKHIEVEQQQIMSYLRKQMKEKKVTIRKLVVNLEVGEATLIGYFKLKTPMPLGIYLEICRVLDHRHYLIPSEVDDSQIKNRIFFS